MIAELPEVVEVAVVGAPHELLGEAIKAFVVPTPNARMAPQKVEAHCRRRLPSFKVPEEVIFLTSMIHNSSGKVLKQELKRMFKSGQLGAVRNDGRPQPEYCPA